MAKIEDVKGFWERNLCLDRYLQSEYLSEEYFKEGYDLRYKYHYHIPREINILKELKGGGKLLEIGLGMGVDTHLLCESGFKVTGVDLTEKSIEATKARLNFHNLSAEIKLGNVEQLEFNDNTFDVVYSFGVLHHTPDIDKAISEVHRVLKKDGIALIMLYHRRSLNYLAHQITRTSFDGPKGDRCPKEDAYTKAEALDMFSRFSELDIKIDYLFGTGWKQMNYFVPVFIKKWLGRSIGWHMLIWATK